MKCLKKIVRNNMFNEILYYMPGKTLPQLEYFLMLSDC